MKQAIAALLSDAVKDFGLPVPIYKATMALSRVKRGSHGRFGDFVYIIHHEDEALYVGSTASSVYLRICAHRSGGRVNDNGQSEGTTHIGRYIKTRPAQPIYVTALEFDGCDTYDIERLMIERLRPRFNVCGVQFKFTRKPPASNT